ncbi:hypothetical protein FTUN_7705 [Frigoriglobus tundricola]|uniref:Uncharacterized protein n=1 Tax=Frigoriglobus tundricola TaxID=2774151 RepID=A0A6M5Z3H9_9BACT|nr:hypothetical protein FTUN_7705 [Frigoriglobus tundricola]
MAPPPCAPGISSPNHLVPTRPRGGTRSARATCWRVGEEGHRTERAGLICKSLFRFDLWRVSAGSVRSCRCQPSRPAPFGWPTVSDGRGGTSDGVIRYSKRPLRAVAVCCRRPRPTREQRQTMKTEEEVADCPELSQAGEKYRFSLRRPAGAKKRPGRAFAGSPGLGVTRCYPYHVPSQGVPTVSGRRRSTSSPTALPLGDPRVGLGEARGNGFEPLCVGWSRSFDWAPRHGTDARRDNLILRAGHLPLPIGLSRRGREWREQGSNLHWGHPRFSRSLMLSLHACA